VVPPEADPTHPTLYDTKDQTPEMNSVTPKICLLCKKPIDSRGS